MATPARHNVSDEAEQSERLDVVQAIIAASGSDSREWEEMQFDLGEGPSRTAFDTRRPVLVPDLSLASGRWPGYVATAMGSRLGAAYALPIQCGAVRFGVLTCYNHTPRTLSGLELNAILTAADRATEAFLGASSDRTQVGRENDQDACAHLRAEPGLLDSMDVRSEIYQAQGMVMAQLDVSLVEALSRMRAHAFASGMTLTALSIGVIEGDISLPRPGG